MKRFLDILIFLGLIGLIGIANQGLLGMSFKPSPPPTFDFEPSLKVTQVLYSGDLAPKVSGYGGAIPTVIALDADNIIRDIQFEKNGETPLFFNQVLDSGITAKWIGRDIETAAHLQVDAISGATMSSEGIIKTVQSSLLAHMGQKGHGSQLSHGDIIKAIAISLIGILGLLSFFAPKLTKNYRVLIATLSIAVLGIWQGSMLSVAKISAWLLSGIPAWGEIPLLLIFIAAISLPYFTGKNFYCYHLCPFGAAQDLVARSIKLNIKVKLFTWLVHIKTIMLLMCFVLLILGLGAKIANIEPFSAFKPEYAPLGAICIFCLALIISTFIPRAWCRFCCPCGALLDLFKRSPNKPARPKLRAKKEDGTA